MIDELYSADDKKLSSMSVLLSVSLLDTTARNRHLKVMLWVVYFHSRQ